MRDERFLRIEPGIIRLFGKADIGAQGAAGGWAAPEEGHSWNDGYDATLRVEVMQRPTTAMTITVEGTPYVFNEARRQDITLYANGYRLGSWRMEERKSIALSARIEPEQWVERDGRVFAALTWHIPNSLRPAYNSDGSDDRCIGFAFGTLLLSEAADA